MKKLFVLFTAILLIVTMSVSVYAAVDAESVEASAKSETITNGEIENFPNENESASKIYNAILDNISGIVSIFTFILSVALTYLYKKGLLPALGGALGKIDSTVESLGIKTEQGLTNAESAVKRIDTRIEGMGEIIETFNTTLSGINKRVVELEEEKKNGESIKVLMRSQVEELWDIFSSENFSEVNLKTVEEKLTEIRAHLKEE